MSRPLPAAPKTARAGLEMRTPWIARPGGMALRDPCRPGSALHRQDNAGRGAGCDGTSFTPANDRSGCWRGGTAMRTSAAASLRLGQRQRPCPAPPKRDGMVAAGMGAGTATALGLGRVRLGLRAWFRNRLRCALLRRALWRPVLRLRERLRHAPPLGD